MYSMFLGQPHESIVSWINGHPYDPPDPPTPPGPTTRTATRVWYGDDENVYTDYEIEGSLEGSYGAMPQPTTQIPNVTSAKKIELGSTVTNIGSFAFATCQELTNVTMTDNIINIGSTAFLYCNKLISIIISNNVTSIGESAFTDCNSLTNITIPDSIITISQYAFSGCSSLTSVTIVATGKEGADAANVKQMMINAECPEEDTVWHMPTGDEHAKTWYKYADDTEWRTVMLDGEIALVDIMGESTGQIDNPYDIVAIEIGTGTQANPVTSIEDYAFAWCSGLTSVTIPSSVTSIGTSAFTSCSGLTSVTIPNSVTEIGMSAFDGCSRLTSVTFLGKTLEQVQNIEDEYGDKNYPWGIADTSIISVA